MSYDIIILLLNCYNGQDFTYIEEERIVDIHRTTMHMLAFKSLIILWLQS